MHEPQGPDPSTLQQLAGMLPSFVQGQAEKRAVGKGKPVVFPKARKVCAVCSKLYDKITTSEDVKLESVPCDNCGPLLKEGYTALVCADYYAFVRSERLKDMAGQIVRIGPQTMEKVKAQYNLEWSKANENPEPPTETR